MRKIFIAGMLSFIVLLLSSGDSYAVGKVPVPTRTVLAADLIGRKLSEGTDKGYFEPDWRWSIEEGEISGLKILSQKISDDYCSFVVSMTLQKEYCPTKYHAMVQMDYSLLKNKWKLTIAKSKGIKIIKTGKYDDCITPRLEGDWFKCLKIKNVTDSPLLVGGIYRKENNHEWKKFSIIISGLEDGYVDVRGSLEAFQIHFVEPY